MSTMMTPEMTDQELRTIKAGIKFLQNNRSVLIERMAEMDEAENKKLLKEYEETILKLDYAVHGLKRMLADAHNAKRAEKASVIGAARYHKTMWLRERQALQKRIGEQRRQLDWLIKSNKRLTESAQAMLNDRVRLLMANEELRKLLISAHHSLGDEPACEGCPKEDCITRGVLTEGDEIKAWYPEKE